MLSTRTFLPSLHRHTCSCSSPLPPSPNDLSVATGWDFVPNEDEWAELDAMNAEAERKALEAMGQLVGAAENLSVDDDTAAAAASSSASAAAPKKKTAPPPPLEPVHHGGGRRQASP